MSPAVQYQKIMSLEAIFFVSGAPKIFLTVIVLVTVVVSVIVNVNKLLAFRIFSNYYLYFKVYRVLVLIVSCFYRVILSILHRSIIFKIERETGKII